MFYVCFYKHRWCVKECVIKAYSNKRLLFPEMRYYKDKNGAPKMEFYGFAKQSMNEQNITQCHISISHDDGFTQAFVVLEKTQT